ncbi:MAG TPA: methyltransferase domain-containing protein [Gammaproteobacteria bacterium]
MSGLKHAVRRIPVIGRAAAAAYVWIAERRFHGSAGYWEARYRSGGTSGSGSYGELARFKAEVLNGLVESNDVRSVIEFGCGDGHQLKLARYPSYLGLDVSPKAVQMCREAFPNDPTKSFLLSRDYAGQTADLALSLDVIYHLVEDEVFVAYMRSLFSAAEKLAVIYASNTDEQQVPRPPHVRHRRFTDWVEANQPSWRLERVIANRFPYDAATGSGSQASFFIYERAG